MKQEVKSEITKNKILDSAEKEFSEKGLSAARVDEIALVAGVNKRMVYAHFGSKEGLYAETLKNVYARRSVYEKQIEEMEFIGLESIREAIILYFDFLLENTSFVKLVLWENLEGGVHVEKNENNLFFGIEHLLNKGVEKGLISKNIDVEQTALSCNLFCFSAFSNVFTLSKMLGKELSDKDSMNKRKEHVADVLVTYIKTVE